MKIPLQLGQFQLGPESNGVLMSPKQFDAIEDCERGWRYELIHGVVIVNPPPLDA